MDQSIAEELKKVMEHDEAVHAMWIAGSVAEGQADELSDIDLWLDIDDGKDKEVFDSIEKFLGAKGELDIKFTEGVTPPYSHCVYHLAGMSPYHFIEVTLHSHSNQIGLFDSLRKIKVLLDKDGTTNFKPFDKVSYDEMLQERKQFLIEKIEFGEQSVTKEIIRRQFLEALHNYQFWLVEPIIELARIKYAPLKVTYGLKHGTRDLPEDAVKQIESLYIIKSLDDLNNKIEEVRTIKSDLV
ncbi:MAG TPA: aminoglycoside 6-adenylyltransferase [Candidatus Saccharimonadales bacterium]